MSPVPSDHEDKRDDKKTARHDGEQKRRKRNARNGQRIRKDDAEFCHHVVHETRIRRHDARSERHPCGIPRFRPQQDRTKRRDAAQHEFNNRQYYIPLHHCFPQQSICSYSNGVFFSFVNTPLSAPNGTIDGTL